MLLEMKKIESPLSHGAIIIGNSEYCYNAEHYSSKSTVFL